MIFRLLWPRPLIALFFALAAVAPACAETVELNGDYGYDPYIAKTLPPGTLIDARAATFHVANSKNASPSSTADCESGELPINAYPLKIYEAPGVFVFGGRFAGEVPLTSDWEFTYCNSVSVGLWDSPYATVQGFAPVRYGTRSGFPASRSSSSCRASGLARSVTTAWRMISFTAD